MTVVLLGRFRDSRAVVTGAYLLQGGRTGGRLGSWGRLSSSTSTAAGTAECASFRRAKCAAPRWVCSSCTTISACPLKTTYCTQVAVSLFQDFLGQLLRIEGGWFFFLRLDCAVCLCAGLVRLTRIWAAHLTHLLKWWVWARHQRRLNGGRWGTDTASWWDRHRVASSGPCAGTPKPPSSSVVPLAVSWRQRQRVTMCSKRLAADNGKAFILLFVPSRSCPSSSCTMRGWVTTWNMRVFVERVVCCGPAALPMTKKITIWLGGKAHGGCHRAEAIDRYGIWCLIVQARRREWQAWVCHGQRVGHRLCRS